MLKFKSLFLRSGLIQIPGFRLRECMVPSKVTWTRLVCFTAVDTSATKRFLSQVQTQHRCLRVRKLSSQFLKPMGSNMMTEETTDNLYSQSTYDIAMEALSSLITGKRRGDVPEISTKYTKLEKMMMYIKILGLDEHIAGLKIIHVAGTKGKGSTCAFCEAILRECGFRTGLFTSPHLIDVRERFRLDGVVIDQYSDYDIYEIPMEINNDIRKLDISEEKFLHYFWECWHQLKENVTNDLPMPALFQFLTVLAFKIFACEKVDVAVIEVGLGGTRDSTNVIKDPVVCGVSPLGMDHMETLGDTLELITSHKAGIFKPEVPAFTVPQLSEAMDVLQERARNLTVPLEVVAPLDHIKLKGMELSLSGDHQLTNASLAVALCKSWLQRTGNWKKLFPHADLEDNLPDAFLRGLSTARLSGRADVIYDSSLQSSYTAATSGDLIFYLDGAHSPESMEACARWFSGTVKEGPTKSSVPSFSSTLHKETLINGNVEPGQNKLEKVSKNILLFNCMDVRDPQILLSKLVDTCALSGTYFEKAIFVPGTSTYTKVTSGSSDILLDAPSKDLTWQHNLQRVWENIIHGTDAAFDNFERKIPEIHEDVSNCIPINGCSSAVVSSLPMAISWLRDYVKENPSFRLQVLVTGSLHLVGDVLKLLRR